MLGAGVSPALRAEREVETPTTCKLPDPERMCRGPGAYNSFTTKALAQVVSEWHVVS
ncbi:hypothetical protein SBV1_730018 [Verrucomicrobia bacterium]|nr:hypothetical protein SBV1_730018 [Verrucomicrobiota bacterium]